MDSISIGDPTMRVDLNIFMMESRPLLKCILSIIPAVTRILAQHSERGRTYRRMKTLICTLSVSWEDLSEDED